MLIILDSVPWSKNKYVNTHWNTRKQYKESICNEMSNFKEFEKDLRPDTYNELPYKKAKITIDIYFKTRRRRDVQNYEGGGLIAFMDCLVDLGFIEDDCWDCMGQPVITFNYDKECPRTEIRIEKRIANGDK